MECTVDIDKRWTCVICYKDIHNGSVGCACSTLRKEVFSLASICSECATAYDKLMADEELKTVVSYLMNKEFWRGHGPVIDF